MRVPDDIKRGVVFFGVPSLKEGVTSTTYRATGFFVAVPRDFGEDCRQGFVYLVTAKHVARALTGRDFVIRANTKDGKSINLRPPDDGPLDWLFHPTDENADVAVFPWEIPPSNIDYRPTSVKFFLKKDQVNPTGVGIGDEVCIVGLFKFHEGTSKNHPMVRVGNIAMIPDEKIETAEGPMDAYLIEARSIGGLSGSPVFVAAPQVGDYWLLIGLIHGHWEVPASKVNDVAPPGTQKEVPINMGIAIVTPAEKILDIIYCQELVRQREKALENIAQVEQVMPSV